MNARWYLVILLALVGNLQHASGQTLYRCESDGKTHFQDSPCAAGQRRVLSEGDIRQVERQKAEERAAATRKLAEREQAAREQKQREAEAQAAAESSAADARTCGALYGADPRVGQSAAHVERCFASPDDKNVTVTAAGRREQWVYRNWGYVYINEQGLVHAVQVRR